MTIIENRIGVTKDFTVNVDYFDYAAGAGYKKYYLAGALDSVGAKYFLTVDSNLISDSANICIAGAADLDFDLTFNNPATVAGVEATINYTTFTNHAAANFRAVWTIYHVSAAAVETSIGTITDSTSNGLYSYHKRCVKLTLTKKHFAIGEKLRVNVITTFNHGDTHLWHDPSGHISSFVDVAGYSSTISSSASINIPFIIDM
jgi:hypothetical protein